MATTNKMYEQYGEEAPSFTWNGAGYHLDGLTIEDYANTTFVTEDVDDDVYL